MIRLIIIKFLILIVSMVVLTSCASAEKQVQTSKGEKRNEGDFAPSFELIDLNGNDVRLADFYGKKVYVKYWTSWCSICLAGLEELRELSKEENDFEVLTVVHPSYRGEKSAEAFKTWFQSLKMDEIDVLFDENGIWSKRYGVIGYPFSIYIGSDGVLMYAGSGHHPNDMIKKIFKEIK